MCSQRKITLLLSVVLQLCIPALAGDCYDNNENYDNCNTCYQTFVNALVNTGDNKYKLSKLFFPIDDISPIQVEIIYNSTSNATEPRVWYWIKGGFYEFQPFQLFELRSLFLATPSWRKSLSLVLPNNCFADYNKTISNKVFFQYATERVRKSPIYNT